MAAGHVRLPPRVVPKMWRISSIGGRLVVCEWDREFAELRKCPLGWSHDTSDVDSYDSWADSAWKRVGIDWGHTMIGMDPPTEGFWFRLRWPTLAAFLMILPSWRARVWVGDRRRRHLHDKGRCASCGYDLRATPKRCPECATAVGHAAG